MAKAKEVYICSQCGYQTPKWVGKCPDCGEWNTMEAAEPIPSAPARGFSASVPAKVQASTPIGEIDVGDEIRYQTGVGELDRVLGGGIVKGSIVLLGGDPGIGKSTLLLQICEYLGRELSILYVSGEESTRQLKLRAARLGVKSPNLRVVSQTDLEAVVTTVLTEQPDLVMVDSIQTMTLAGLTSSAGSVTQVRECTARLMHLAKDQEIPIFVVGHVNKDGNIAGPKVLEHIVDAVLYFEGDKNLSYRILRAVKNRYGSTNEIGVFEMLNVGLRAVDNPSMMLLEGRPTDVSGTCVACVMEGTRPIMAEVQALVAKTSFGTPRRMAAGCDYNRMALILAVLEKRAGFFFGALDAYVNIIGGLRLDDTAADLAIALALVSGLRDKPLDGGLLAFGEIGLAGEVRAVSGAYQRVREAARLGFTKCVLPRQSLKQIPDSDKLGIELLPVSNLKQAFALL